MNDTQYEKAKKSRSVALGVLIIVVVLAAVFGCARSVGARKSKVVEEFYREPGVHSDLMERAAQTHNLATLGEKYLGEADALVKDARKAAETLENAEAPRECFDADAELTSAAAALSEGLSAAALSEKDADYVRGIGEDLDECTRIIIHDEYNALARDYNENVRGAFPASVISPILGIEKLAVFE